MSVLGAERQTRIGDLCVLEVCWLGPDLENPLAKTMPSTSSVSSVVRADARHDAHVVEVHAFVAVRGCDDAQRAVGAETASGANFSEYCEMTLELSDVFAASEREGLPVLERDLLGNVAQHLIRLEREPWEPSAICVG